MALIDRVAMLVRANLNDLIDRAEEPEKMIKQVILDMQNQLLQLKTQAAIAIADLHVLERKQTENETAIAEWEKKADMALSREQEELARAAVERSLSYRGLRAGFEQQTEAQRAQVGTLKGGLSQLTEKLREAEAKSELLIAQHRRARAVQRAGEAASGIRDPAPGTEYQRMKDKVLRAEALVQAQTEVANEPVEARFAEMEKREAVDKLLAELKARRK